MPTGLRTSVGAREVYTFRTTSLFEQMVRIGTPINKPTPRSIVTSLVSSFLLAPSLRSFSSVHPFCFSRLPFLFLFRRSFRLPPFLLPPLPPVVLPRPRKANKPLNSSGILRDSGLPLGTPATSPAFLYSASRLSVSEQTFVLSQITDPWLRARSLAAKVERRENRMKEGK